ncbi:MAG TPA: enoyl-CoA hydratase/isomerase family protein [Gemmatimonadales bacterium]|nr:enoyl-CoA hydratase/isomerase family protein [Gemmatimonadales bacterium]
MAEQFRIELADGVLTCTLDRADKRNALSADMIGGLAELLARAELEAAVRVVVIRGAGKDFCAGADLAELLASVDRPIDENERDALHLGEVFLAIRRLPKPVVAVVQGRALAGGAGLATACDLVVAARSASFGYPEIERGFVPAMVLTMLRRAVGEKRAFELVATGRVIGADEALEMGLISRCHDDAQLDSAADAMIRELAGRSPTALALTKQLFTDLDGRGFGEGILLGARVNALSRSTPDFRAAVGQFLSR